MPRFFGTSLALLLLIWPSVKTHALEVLSAAELAAYCQAVDDDRDDDDAASCIRYVQGFVDGAVATDVRVMINVEAEAATDPLTRRAMRTRMIDRNEQRRAAGFAEFCLAEPVALMEIVHAVIDDLNSRTAGGQSADTARDLVYDSLRRHYPCQDG